MPPNPKTAAPKLGNNTLVWNAVAKQIDIPNEFKLIWNKLDQVQLAADMGVGTTNAASKRFKRWITWMVEQSVKANGDAGDAGDSADTAEAPDAIAKPVRGKVTEAQVKNKMKREGAVLESAKKGPGMIEAVGKRNRTEDEGLTDKKQEKQKSPGKLVKRLPKENRTKFIEMRRFEARAPKQRRLN